MKKSAAVIASAFALILSLGVGTLSATADSLSEAEQKKNELESSLNEAKKLVNSLRGDVADAQGNIQSLDKQIDAMEAEAIAIQGEMRDADERLSQAEADIAAKQEELEKRYKAMEIRIVYSYENGRNNMFNKLFSSKDFSGIMRAIDYAAAVQEFDNMVISEYEQELVALNNARTAAENERAKIDELAVKNANQTQALEILKDAKEGELEKLDGELTDAQSIAAAYEAEVKAQNEVLSAIRRAIEEEKRRQEEERKRQEEERKRREEERKRLEAEAAANGTAPPEDIVEEEPAPVVTPSTSGNFSWPCPASRRITSEYGPRTSPTAGASSNHKGIDIGAPRGSDIVAADSGKVILATYSSSAGNYVIVSHGVNSEGKTICSVYMHCDQLLVQEGASVSRGQVIAKVGSTGVSTGPHLHFGVTEDGAYVSPWGYVSL